MMRLSAPSVLAVCIYTLCSCPLCSGHGHMTLPPSRNGGTLDMAADCMKGECMWFSQPDAGGVDPTDKIAEIPGDPTLPADERMRTYNVDVWSGPTDYSRTHPWRAPGAAAVIGSGCGRAGGGTHREFDGGTAKEFGLVQDMDGLALPASAVKTVWKVGAIYISCVMQLHSSEAYNRSYMYPRR